VTTDTQDSADERRRKRLIRIVVVLALAVPLVIEGLTFGGLLSSTLLGGGDDGGTVTPDGTATTTAGVGVGDELLAATPQRETIRTASVQATGETWTLTLSATVNNTANSSYQFQLGTVETTGGETVSNSASVTVPPGETETVTGQWSLPAGERPRAIQVLAVEDVGGNATVSRETVRLAPIPVQGR
jgi:hypothetical protein